jgi:hypothetical protein
MLEGWAYGAIYASSAERAHSLPAGLTTTITTDHTAASLTSHPDTGSQHYRLNNVPRHYD